MTEAIERIEKAQPRRFRRYPEYKDSGIEWLGEIPAHWSAKRLKFVVPARISKLDTKPDNVAYVGLEHIESWTGRLLLETQPESVDSVVSSFVRGDVLFGKLRPYLAKAARPDFDGVCTSEILSLRPTHGCFQSYVMYCLLNAPYIHWLDSMTYGTKMPRVSPDQVGSSRIPLPPEFEQRTIAAAYRAAMNHAAGLDREARETEARAAEAFEEALGFGSPTPFCPTALCSSPPSRTSTVGATKGFFVRSSKPIRLIHHPIRLSNSAT